LAHLLADLTTNPQRLAESRHNLQSMSFHYWDDEMAIVARDWMNLPTSTTIAT
jgi:hypothetical protein